MIGIEIGVPRTVVRRSGDGVSTADRGWKLMSSNARTFSRSVTSPSAPPSMYSKTDRGSRRRAASRKSSILTMGTREILEHIAEMHIVIAVERATLGARGAAY
jgi:hypothetical protein